MKPKVLVAIVVIAICSTTAMAAQFQFNPRPYANAEYTDNLFLSGSDKRDEYIFTLSPAFDAAVLGKTAALEISYDPAYQFYDEFDENDGWTHNARLFAYNNFSKRTRFQLANRFLLTRDPLGEEDLIRDRNVVIPGDTTNRTDREEYYTNALSAQLNHKFGEDDSVYADFLYSFLRNDDSQVEDNDRYEPSVGLNYWFGPKFGTEFRGAFTRGEFDRSSDFIGTPTGDFDNWFGSFRLIGKTSRHFSFYGQYDQVYRDYDGDIDNDYLIYSPSAGLLYLFEKDLTFRLGAGYYYQQIDGGDDEQGIYPSAEANKLWGYKRGLIDLVGRIGLDQNNFGAQNLGFGTFADISTTAGYYFTRNFSGIILGRFRFDGPTDTDESGGVKEQYRTQIGAGLAYRPLKWMALGLTYRFTKFAANGDENYDENRGMFTVTLQPDQPWKY